MSLQKVSLVPVAIALLAVTLGAAQRGRTQTAPETFRAQLQSRTASGALAASGYVLARDAWRCRQCGKPARTVHLDPSLPDGP